jgi:hypothetical protein
MHAGKKENTLASLALLHITSECYIYVCVTGDTGIYCSRQRILAPEITSIISSFLLFVLGNTRRHYIYDGHTFLFKGTDGYCFYGLNILSLISTFCVCAKGFQDFSKAFQYLYN